MSLSEWLLISILVVGILNFGALAAIAALLWNIDANAAKVTNAVASSSHHATINQAAERIERAIRR